jgi:hypothetical protein
VTATCGEFGLGRVKTHQQPYREDYSCPPATIIAGKVLFIFFYLNIKLLTDTLYLKYSFEHGESVSIEYIPLLCKPIYSYIVNINNYYTAIQRLLHSYTEARATASCPAADEHLIFSKFYI